MIIINIVYKLIPHFYFYIDEKKIDNDSIKINSNIIIIIIIIIINVIIIIIIIKKILKKNN